MRAKANDSEPATLWQTLHEQDQGRLGRFHAVVGTHAATAVNEEDEMEIRKTTVMLCVFASHLRLQVVCRL